jgi:hypothetical protein
LRKALPFDILSIQIFINTDIIIDDSYGEIWVIIKRYIILRNIIFCVGRRFFYDFIVRIKKAARRLLFRRGGPPKGLKRINFIS